MAENDKRAGSWQTAGFMLPEEVSLPPEERLTEGPVAVIECPQEIPCDPCRENCPTGAITMEGINGIPEVDHEKCTGCSICVESCPGLAIFTVDASPEQGCRITLPYEFGLPEIGEDVIGLNRKGKEVTRATVEDIKTKDQSAADTPTVTVKLPEKYINEVRNIRRSE